MTVRELIDELKYYDGDSKVIIKSSNSMYTDSIGSTMETEVRSFWGDDYRAVVICGDEQCGAC